MFSRIGLTDSGYKKWRKEVEKARVRKLSLSLREEVRNPHGDAVSALGLDTVSGRYLLSGGIAGGIAVHDLNLVEGATEVPTLISTSAADKHRFYVTSVEWYPFDTGAFISSSMDGTVKIWDANAFAPAVTINLKSSGKVYGASALCSEHHSLIAAPTELHGIRLCDMNSSASIHTLVGHQGATFGVTWNPSHEHQLASCGADGTVKMWDVRKSGTSASLLSLDWQQDHTAHSNCDVYNHSIDHRMDSIARAHEDAVMALTFSP
jgi:DNA excision repair protein ERCC-8